MLVVTENRAGDFLESVPVTYMGSDRYEVLDDSRIQLAPSKSDSSIFITGLPAYKDPSKDVKWQVVPDVILEQLFRLPANGTANKKFIVHGIDNLGSEASNVILKYVFSPTTCDHVRFQSYPLTSQIGTRSAPVLGISVFMPAIAYRLTTAYHKICQLNQEGNLNKSFAGIGPE